MKSGILLLISCFALVLCSCNKEEKKNRRCKNFDTACAYYPVRHYNSYSYEAPCFNPNNEQEFICLRKDGQKTALIKYNLTTKQTQVLLEDFPIIGKPKWGGKGWIVFSTTMWKIFKVKDDGSGLEQISNTPHDLSPEFSPSGDTILYYRGYNFSNAELEENPDLRKKKKYIFINLEGVQIDSSCGNGECTAFGSYISWGANNKILYENAKTKGGIHYYAGLYDYPTKSASEDCLFTMSEAPIYDIVWHPLNAIFYISDRDGIRFCSISEKSTRYVKESCDERSYEHISVSPSGTRILAAREDVSVMDNCNFKAEKYIVVMDFLGNNEERVQIE